MVHENHVYAIFWQPPGHSFPSDYRDAVATYFAGVAADSGKRTNVYSTVGQYRDVGGPASGRIAFEGSYTSATALPGSGCEDGLNPVCLTDAQLAEELDRVIVANDLPRGLGAQYFLFTPPDVGSCFDGTGDACANLHYCGYHSYSGEPETVLYASLPFVAGSAACDMGESPTGTSADAVLNMASHEHVEMITNPTGSGWYDADGEEIADRCAWEFGATGGEPGALYNQVIGETRYLLQLVWSDQDGACVVSPAEEPPVEEPPVEEPPVEEPPPPVIEEAVPPVVTPPVVKPPPVVVKPPPAVKPPPPVVKPPATPPRQEPVKPKKDKKKKGKKRRRSATSRGR